jgi:oligopeptide transport system ATP-binding protein
VNNFTVRLQLNARFSPLTAQLADRAGMIMSPKALTELGTRFATAPVCVGPFKFGSRAAGDRIVLDKSQFYYARSKVKLNRIVFRIITDTSARAANLRAKDINVLDRIASTDLPAIQRDKSLRVLKATSIGYQGISINIGNKNGLGKPFENVGTPLASRRALRHAFELSLDRKVINRVVFGGTVLPGCLPVPPTSPYYDASIKCPGPGRRRRPGGSSGRDVRRPQGRGGAGLGALRAPAAPVHDRTARRSAARRGGSQRPAAGDSGPRPLARRVAAALRLRRPVPTRGRAIVVGSPRAPAGPSRPRRRLLPSRRAMTSDRQPVLEVEGLVKHFTLGRGVGKGGRVVHAVDGVSFSIAAGEVLGLVGESGSGKTTVGYCVNRLYEPTTGTIQLNGADITHLSRRALRPHRRQMHIVFEDPYSSLNPRMTCGQIVGEPIRLHRLARRSELDGRVSELFDAVGLRPELRFRYPHELSGGQRQRVGLARALSVSPSLLIPDEPVSALDVSVQASVLNLLRDLPGQARVLVPLHQPRSRHRRVSLRSGRGHYLGKIVELAPREELFARPQHPYTQALLSAAVVPDPEVQRTRTRIVLDGDIPSPISPPSGCRFRTRCPLEQESAPRSTEEEPPLVDVTGQGHFVACHLVRRGTEAPRIAESPVELAR